ncbi:hypothetical protein QTO34_000006 [Cnephaeus nilssonii]|uniref:Uncharacterized protein n=1 Tax=Cnephaeus nilssonii TaxID=3371016 RepID=A0AA40LW48_CNENI|nr:hypothetical protein QTO34_000006 [Eptesicus nilssonii]
MGACRGSRRSGDQLSASSSEGAWGPLSLVILNPGPSDTIRLDCASEIGPLGLSSGKGGDDVAKATSDCKPRPSKPPKSRQQQREAKKQPGRRGSGLSLENSLEPLKRSWDCQSVGCNVDGRRPHDITDDVSSGAVECPAS